jgi:hypothetical protein
MLIPRSLRFASLGLIIKTLSFALRIRTLHTGNPPVHLMLFFLPSRGLEMSFAHTPTWMVPGELPFLLSTVVLLCLRPPHH